MTHSWEESLSVVIPAFNEESGIRATLLGLREMLPDAELIVVDDGSKDRTTELALEIEGVRVIQHTFNRGYGAALKTGMRVATRAYVAWFDADNEHRVEDLAAMTQRISEEDLVAVVGRRPRPGPSTIRNSGKLAIRLLARILGVDAGKDLNCGLRVFRREFIMRHRSLLPDAYSASLTSTMVLIERRYRFAFHDVRTNPRLGQSKVRLSHGVSTLAMVLRMVMLFAPMRIFFVPGVLMLLAGLFYGLFRALGSGQGFPVASILMTMTGLLSAMLGLVADQISQMRLIQLGNHDEDEARELTRLPKPLGLPDRMHHDSPAQASQTRDPSKLVV